MASHIPDLESVKAFKKATNAGVFRDRNSLIPIDQELGSWHNTHKHNDASTQRSGLVQLTARCTGYLQVKCAKRDSSTRPSDRLIRRIAAVQQLNQQAFTRLAYVQHELKKTGNPVGAALGQAERGKLKAGYRHERTAFTAHKKSSNPHGASFVETEMHAASNPQNVQELGVVLPPNIAALVQRPFGTLSLAEFDTLHRYFSANKLAGMHSESVHFCRKDERLRHHMLIPIDGMLFKPDGGGKPDGNHIYAMDAWGNLISARSNHSFADGSNLNHSSLCAGREVICAGEITFQNGFITEISNESGHYKPSAQRLGHAIQVLNEEYDLHLGQTLTAIRDLASGRDYDSLAAFRAVVPTI